MKKNTITEQSLRKRASAVVSRISRTAKRNGPVTIGMDLGDKSSRYCVLDEGGRSGAGTQRGEQ